MNQQNLIQGDEKPGLLASLGGDFDIADLCLLGVLSGRDGGFRAGRNGSTSHLVVTDGALVHASCGDLQGLAAFKQILSWKRLEFDWLPAAASPDLPSNVRLDTSWLLKIARWRQQETSRADGLLSEIHLQDLLSLLARKQETGILTVAAADRVGALMLQDGRIVQADTDEGHGQEAVDEIFAWQDLRATYSRTASGPLAHAGDTAMTDLEKLIDEQLGEIDSVLSSSIVRLSDGQILVERASDPAFTPPLASYATVMRSHLEAVELLGGSGTLGATEDLLIFLEKTCLLIRMLGPDHFHALLLASPSNPALARYVMRNYEPFLLEVLERAGR